LTFFYDQTDFYIFAGQKTSFVLMRLNVSISNISAYGWIWFDVGVDYSSSKMMATWVIDDGVIMHFNNATMMSTSFGLTTSSNSYDLVAGGPDAEGIGNCSCNFNQFKFYPNVADYYPFSEFRKDLGISYMLIHYII